MAVTVMSEQQHMRVVIAADAPAGTAKLVEGMVSAPPPGATPAEWKWALEGFKRFLDGGWSTKAIEAGWSENELFALPSNWHRLDETGAAWLIGRWEIVDVDATAITVKPPWSQSRLKFYRRPS
jgi:hypothetical protein